MLSHWPISLWSNSCDIVWWGWRCYLANQGERKGSDRHRVSYENRNKQLAIRWEAFTQNPIWGEFTRVPCKKLLPYGTGVSLLPIGFCLFDLNCKCAAYLASNDRTMGGNWSGSPTKINFLANSNGRMTVVWNTWVDSSTKQTSNCFCVSRACAAPRHVTPTIFYSEWERRGISLIFNQRATARN